MPVLMLHGAGGGGWEWTVWRRVFVAAGWVTVAPTLAPVANGLAATTLADYAAQVRAAIEAMPRPRIVAGASLGGLLAWLHADLVDALVLVNPLPPAPASSRLPMRDPWPAVIPWGAQSSLAGTRRSLFDADEAACLLAFRHWRDESGAVMTEACAGVAAPEPSCPVLMVISGADSEVPATLSQSVAHDLGAREIFLPQASHVGPLLGRDAAGVAIQTVTFLNEAFPRGSN